jgi:O-antigen/teichoic acid export membrane protein
MSPTADPSRLIVRGSQSAAAGFAVRLGARLGFLFIAGQFGTTLFGAYALAVGLVELAVSVGGLGMKKLIFQFLDAEDGRARGHILAEAAILVAGASLALAAVMAAYGAFAPDSLVASNTAWALVVLAPMIAGQALLDLLLAATRWKHRMRYEVVARSIVEPYAALGVATAAYFIGFRESGLLVSYWFGTLAALAYAAIGVRRCFGSLNLGSMRLRDLRPTAYLRLSGLNTGTDLLNALFGRLDLFFVGFILGESATGIYGMARQIRIPIRQIRQSFDGLLTPIVARTLQVKGPAETGLGLASASRLILSLQLPVLIGLLAIGVPLLDAFGPGFAAGYWALVMLAAAESVQGAFGVGDLIFVYREPWLGLRITLASVVIGLALGFSFTWASGINGAAASVLATFLIRAFLRRLALSSQFGVRVPLGHSIAPLTAAAAGIAAMLAAELAVHRLPELAGGIVAGVIGSLVYLLVLRLWLSVTGQSLEISHFALDERHADPGQDRTLSNATETR